MEKTIERTLLSCLYQSFDKDVEYLLIDNSSTDDTYMIASKFLTKIPNFRIIRNDFNIGAYGNHNIAIKYAKNDWIKFLHGDDELLPNSISTLKNYLYSENVHFIFFDFCGNHYYNNFHKNQVFINNKLAELLIKYGNFIGTPSTTIFRKKSFENIGLFDLDLNPASDADAFFRLSLYHGGLFLNLKLVKIDDDPFDSYTSYEKNKLMFLNNTFLQLTKWKNLYKHNLNNINWNNVYKNESFRFFDSSIILISRIRFKLFFRLCRHLLDNNVFFISLYFYLKNKIKGNTSLDIRNKCWYHEI
jgi:glycosyltransferase involved in cell wall biosynthesis